MVKYFPKKRCQTKNDIVRQEIKNFYHGSADYSDFTIDKDERGELSYNNRRTPETLNCLEFSALRRYAS